MSGSRLPALMEPKPALCRAAEPCMMMALGSMHPMRHTMHVHKGPMHAIS